MALDATIVEVPKPPAGRLPFLMLLARVVSNPVASWGRDFYEEPIVVYDEFGLQTVFVVDPELIQAVLLDDIDSFSKSPIYKHVLGEGGGEGVLIAEGERWRCVIARLSHFSEHAKPDSAAIRATELLGKTERMFVDVTEGSGPAGEVSQLRSYTLEELRELRAVMVDGVRPGQVAIEAPAAVVVEVEARVIDDEDAGAHAREEEDDGGNQGIHDSLV